MNLILRGVSFDDGPLGGPPLVGFFDEHGGDIGRSEDATFTLPDPRRSISRVQARIKFDRGHYTLENVGGANPILHNKRPVVAGVRVTLAAGDEIRIGGYALEVELENSASTLMMLRSGGAAELPPIPRAAPPAGARRAPPTLRGVLADPPGESEATRFDLRPSLIALRNAFEAALEQFSPERLEARFGAAPPAAAGGAGAERLWAAYRDQYAIVRDEARAEFERAFGGGDSRPPR